MKTNLTINNIDMVLSWNKKN